MVYSTTQNLLNDFEVRNNHYSGNTVPDAFKQHISNYCDKKRKLVKFRAKQKKYSSEDFWDAIKDDLDSQLVNDVKKYRDLVLNTFSHYNTEKHEICTELIATIQTIQNLETALST